MLPLLAMASQIFPSVLGSVLSCTGQHCSQTPCTLGPLQLRSTTAIRVSSLATEYRLLSRMDDAESKVTAQEHVMQIRLKTA